MHLYLVAAEGAEHLSEPAIDPYVVGGIALGILVILMAGLLAFGKGREHS